MGMEHVRRNAERDGFEACELEELTGVGTATAGKLSAYVGDSFEDLAAASVDDLLQIKGLGKRRLVRIQRQLQSLLECNTVFTDNHLLARSVEANGEDILQYEVGIVWEEDPTKYDFIREQFTRTRRTAGPTQIGGAKTLGYAELHPETPPAKSSARRYWRRVFYIKDHDLDGGDPIEAVDPEKIDVGERPEGTSPHIL